MALKRKREGSSSSADSIKPKTKPKWKQISASTSKRPNMHWKTEWNMPFLDLLDDICKGRERSIGRAFDNEFWLEFAPLFCTKIGKSGITAEDCKEKTRFFEKKHRDYKGDPQTAEDRKIYSVYQRTLSLKRLGPLQAVGQAVKPVVVGPVVGHGPDYGHAPQQVVAQHLKISRG